MMLSCFERSRTIKSYWQPLLFIESPQVADGFVPVLARYFSEGQKSEGMTYHQIPLGWTGVIDLFTYDERHLRSINVENGQLISHIRYQTEEPKVSSRAYSSFTNCQPGYWVDFPYFAEGQTVTSKRSVWVQECSVNLYESTAFGTATPPAGGGGTGSTPPPPPPGETPKDEEVCEDNFCLPFPDEVLGIDCKSFLFSSVGSNWQEAGVSGVRFKVVYVDGSIRESREITIPRPLYFGLPKNHHIEGNISEDEASNIAAGATQRASDLTSALLQSNPQMNDIQLQNSFKKYLEGQLFYYGGRVSFYPSPGYAGAVFPAKYKFLGNGDC